MSLAALEADKYRRMWQCDAYATHSPGEQWLPTFLALVKEERYGRLPGSVIDIGCGTGRAARKLAEAGFDVALHDVVPEAVCEDLGPVRSEPIWDLTGDYDYGYCCDVFEHLPTEYVMASLRAVMATCQRAFLTICTEPDAFGVHIGEPLHLTVRPFVWWRDRAAEVATVLDARDCLNTTVLYLERRGN